MNDFIESLDKDGLSVETGFVITDIHEIDKLTALVFNGETKIAYILDDENDETYSIEMLV